MLVRKLDHRPKIWKMNTFVPFNGSYSSKKNSNESQKSNKGQNSVFSLHWNVKMMELRVGLESPVIDE